MMSKVFSSKFFTFLLLILQLINVNGEILKLRIQKKDYHLNERIDITFPSNVKCQSGTVVTLIGQNQNKYGNTKLQCQNTSRGYLKLPSKLDNSYEKVDNYFLNWNYGNSQIQTEPFFKLMNNPNTDSKKDKAITESIDEFDNVKTDSKVNPKEKDANGKNFKNNILFGVVFLLIGCVMVLSVRLIKTSSENKTIKKLRKTNSGR
ncbi:hypothetical protein BCR32DRAFT_251609 [Anaeromyces robustus]|uniref:IPT/TIG domain-containing protein n=1 Tax=Anaeromyces robustus TaxID=1754192 RepID=A0A1Y1VQH1_9FUNG|nr:hypothetical protein BCR32DRAFT_251609 [Anaeromyces robustus]|eukprot:ORX63393.1 hypothetical protein BCR32DRAFT_251609 [Anaeromyces robustus]